jgi:RimJ/RimL family protein N-acetyltransferase
MPEQLPKNLGTQRLFLRPYEVGDARMLYAAGKRNQRHLSLYESGNFILQIKNEDHAETIIRDLVSSWQNRAFFFYGLFEKETGDWAGQIYIGPANMDLPEFVIGYIVDVDHEGMGYVTEAVNEVTRMLFEELGAHRVRADCNETNTRSWHLLERCGFKREGHLRENKANPDGSYHGDYLYAMLKSDFFQRLEK